MRLRRQNPMDKKNEKVRLLVVRLADRYSTRYTFFSLLSSLFSLLFLKCAPVRPVFRLPSSVF